MSAISDRNPCSLRVRNESHRAFHFSSIVVIPTPYNSHQNTSSGTSQSLKTRKVRTRRPPQPIRRGPEGVTETALKLLYPPSTIDTSCDADDEASNPPSARRNSDDDEPSSPLTPDLSFLINSVPQDMVPLKELFPEDNGTALTEERQKAQCSEERGKTIHINPAPEEASPSLGGIVETDLRGTEAISPEHLGLPISDKTWMSYLKI